MHARAVYVDMFSIYTHPLTLPLTHFLVRSLHSPIHSFRFAHSFRLSPNHLPIHLFTTASIPVIHVPTRPPI